MEPAPEPEQRSGRGRRLGIAAAVVGGLAAVILILIAAGVFEGVEDEPAGPAPAPQPAATRPGTEEQPAADASDVAEQLGFPAFATKNTTRVGGTDAPSNAAGVALATYPSAGGSERPVAVTLVAEDDWQAATAASVLMAAPVRAPLLVASAGGDLPAVTEQALSALDPQGSVETRGSQVFVIGDAAAPEGLEARRAGGRDPAAVAAAVERLHSRLVRGKPDHIVVVSSAKASYSVPAAAWAARSGDPVLFTRSDELPVPTEKTLKRYPKVPVYVLGPAAAVSDRVLSQISRAGGPVRRIEGEDPVTNAIEFARYTDGTFGWNVNDPGHGFVVARADRPLDAAVASPLSAAGTWGPLLLTDSAATLPGALRGYLLDVKPGYRNDPTRALYNHVWIVGDQGAIDVDQQAAIDDLAELALIQPAGAKPGAKPAGAKPGGGPTESGSGGGRGGGP